MARPLSAGSYYKPRDNVVVDGILIIPASQQKRGMFSYVGAPEKIKIPKIVVDNKVKEKKIVVVEELHKNMIDYPMDFKDATIMMLKNIAAAIGVKSKGEIKEMKKPALLDYLSKHVVFASD